MVDVVVAKLIIATMIFCISLLSSIAPLKVIHMSDQVFSMGNLLASGVLLAAGLVHQLPGAIDNLRHSGSDFPVATFIAGLTFCTFLIFEEFMHSEFNNVPFHSHGSGRPSTATTSVPAVPSSPNKAYHGNDNDDHHHHHHQHDHGHSHRRDDDHQKQKTSVSFRAESIISYINPAIVIDEKDEEELHREKNNHDDNHDKTAEPLSESTVLLPTLTTTLIESSSYGHALAHVGSSLISDSSTHSIIANSRRCGDDAAGMISIRKSSRPTILECFRDDKFEFEHPVHHHDEHLANHMHGSLLASLILLCALSVHSIFDGMSIGIGRTMSEVLGSTAAVLAHKAFASYALGSAMVASEMKETHFLVLCLAFSVCSICGIFLGMLFEQFSGAEDSTPTGVIQAMVAGTFLYVSIVEIGMKELMMHRESAASHQTGDDKGTMNVRTLEYSRLLSFLAGYLLMSLLAIWV